MQEGLQMSLITRENQFEGVNPLLHSLYQEPGIGTDHSTFHSTFAYNIAKQLNTEAGLENGYFAVPNEPLFLTHVPIRQEQRSNNNGAGADTYLETEAAQGTDDLHSVVISKRERGAESDKKPLTVIEVLSLTDLGSK